MQTYPRVVGTQFEALYIYQLNWPAIPLYKDDRNLMLAVGCVEIY